MAGQSEIFSGSDRKTTREIVRIFSCLRKRNACSHSGCRRFVLQKYFLFGQKLLDVGAKGRDIAQEVESGKAGLAGALAVSGNIVHKEAFRGL